MGVVSSVVSSRGGAVGGDIVGTLLKTFRRGWVVFSALTFVLLGFALTSCAGTKGRVAVGTYYAPLKNFSMPIPFAGPRIQDGYGENGGYVSFSNTWGGLKSVLYERLPPEVAKMASDPGQRDQVFREYLHKQAMPNIFRKASAQATLLREEILTADGAYFALVRIPEASNVFDVRENRFLDSVRSLLIFGKADFLYMLTEEADSSIESQPSVIDSLIKTRDSMAFDRGGT